VTEAEGVFPATTSRRISSSVRLLPGTRFEGSSFNRPCPHDDPLGAARSLGQRDGSLTSHDADLGSKHHDAQTRESRARRRPVVSTADAIGLTL